jgi:hypothetical protein
MALPQTNDELEYSHVDGTHVGISAASAVIHERIAARVSCWRARRHGRARDGGGVPKVRFV